MKPCPYAGLVVDPRMAKAMSEGCKWGDDCHCKGWRDWEPPVVKREWQGGGWTGRSQDGKTFVVRDLDAASGQQPVNNTLHSTAQTADVEETEGR